MITRQYKNRFEVTESRRLTWYPALFDQETRISEPGPDGATVTYTEVIRAGAFAATLKDRGQNVTANIDHDDSQLFAQTFDGSLLLQEDAKGLFASCWLPEGELGDRIIRDVQNGTLDGASFRFGPVKDRVTRNGDFVERLAVTLADVCLTSHPAYPQTEGEVLVRSTQPDNTKLRATQAKLRLLKLKLKNQK